MVATLRDLEDHRLGSVDRVGDVVRQVVGDLGDLLGDADQPAQQRVLLDDAGVAAGAGDRRRVRLQRDERGGAADVVEHAGAAELLGDGDGVGRLAPGVERGDRREDLRVRRA